MNTEDYNNITRMACNDECTRFREHKCPWTPNNKIACYLWQVKRSEYESVDDNTSNAVILPDIQYIVVLFCGQDIRGYYHTVQRAKRDAKLFGLTTKMRIVEYQMCSASGNRCNLVPKYLHTWSARWISYVI